MERSPTPKSHFGREGRDSTHKRSALEVDTRPPEPNNLRVSKPEIVRRIKTYSAANGFVYQYQFQEMHPTAKPSPRGNEYVYNVSADRKTMFTLRVVVSREALDLWAARSGRPLTGTEEYAVAKMRLFQAFDEEETLDTMRPAFQVNVENLDALIESLNL